MSRSNQDTTPTIFGELAIYRACVEDTWLGDIDQIQVRHWPNKIKRDPKCCDPGS